MRKITFIFMITALLSCNFATADIVHDESVDGDLSNDSNNPTAFVLEAGINTFIGSTQSTPLNPDFFSVEIPDGASLEQIVLSVYDTTEDQSFFAVAEGGSMVGDGSDFLGSAVIGAAAGAQQGDDVLDDLGNAGLGGTGFTGPLASGTYTFWYQENAADTNYQFDFVVSVPEPATGVIALAALGLVASRRRR